jgi:hypothetical protein
MVPDLDAFPTPIRYLLLGVLVGGPLVFVVLVLLGASSTPTVVVEATVVDSGPPSPDAAVYPLSRFPDDSPVRVAAAEALETGSASVEATTDEVQYDGVPHTGYYVEHDGRTVRIETHPD